MTADLGAYGLRLPGLPGQHWLNPAAADWPAWRFRVGNPVPADGRQWLGPQDARVTLLPDGVAEIDRPAATTTVRPSARPPDAAWAHPLLASTAIVAAEWASRLTFHGGSFLDGTGGVWAVLGDRGRGKSTTLAWLRAHDSPVFADDLLVTDGRTAYAGPRCLDLRAGAAERFEGGVDIGVVGTRRRFRVDLPPVPPTAPLRGVIVLEWAGQTVVRPASAPEKAALLRPYRALRVGQAHPLAWLHLLAVPVVLVARPQRWEALDATMERVLAAVREHT